MPIEQNRIDQYNFHKSASPVDYELLLMDWFYAKSGYKFDLKYPVTINEKIQWMKIFGNMEQFTELTDKFLVRKYVKDKVGADYLIPLFGVWEKFSDINFTKLPEKFVLKCNHGCEMNAIISDNNSETMKNIETNFNEWLGLNFAFFNGFELQYKNISPKIIAEKYVENRSDDLDDYKIWCFDGKPRYITYMTNRKKQLQELFFDTKWKQQNFIISGQGTNVKVTKPNNLNEMLGVAASLSNNIPFVRVDLYRLNDGSIKFGEMTFSPASGTFKWNPPIWNKRLGDLFLLPKSNLQR